MLIGTSIDIFQNSHLQYYHILYVNVTVLPFISVLLFSLFLELSFHMPADVIGSLALTYHLSFCSLSSG
jgi:hypothetical protein